jgi:hypothetical protein
MLKRRPAGSQHGYDTDFEQFALEVFLFYAQSRGHSVHPEPDEACPERLPQAGSRRGLMQEKPPQLGKLPTDPSSSSE